MLIEETKVVGGAPGLAGSDLLRLAPSLPWLAALMAFALASVRGKSLLHDPDTFLHIAAGRWMMAHGALPALDPFSHSMPGAPWIVHEWLSELILGAVFGALGWHGIILLTASCFALSIAILARFLLDRGEAMTALVVAVAAGYLLEPHLVARPHILALPAMTLWCAALAAARARNRRPPFLLLPLMVLWANLHGSFVVGLGLAGFLAAEVAIERAPAWRAELRQWIVFTGVAALAAMLTPNGIASFLLPLRFMAMPVLHDSFNEWLSVNFHAPQPLELWLLGLIFGGLSLGLRLPLWRLLFLLGLTHLALQAARHADLLAVLAPFLVWPSWGPQLRARMEASGVSEIGRLFARLSLPMGGWGLASTAAIAAVLAVAASLPPVATVDGPATPVAALATARTMGLSGPVLNEEGFGGYLVFNGVPTFIDGRIEMYGDDFLARYLGADRGDEAALTGLLDNYHIAWTMFSPQSGAAIVLNRLPGWRRVYADAWAVIDVRTGG
jgi:hypothetical protein